MGSMNQEDSLQDRTCAEVVNNLPWYVGGDLEGDLQVSIDEHLAQCAPCAAHAMRARDARQAFVTDLRARETRGPNLWPGVRATLAQEGLLQRPVQVLPGALSSVATTAAQNTSAASGARGSPRRFWVLGSAAAAAVLVGFWLGRDLLDTRVDPVVGPIAGNVARPNADRVATNVPGNQPSIPVTPVAEATGLRRIGSSEVPLRQSADIFLDSPFGQGPQFTPPNAGAPASLRQVRRTQ
jgi:hypothetical protein